MAKEKFTDQNFRKDSHDRIALVNSILAEYAQDGYDLSLRQLYYQLVARGHIENSQKSYKRMGDLVNNARLAGLVDWDMIKDRNRETVIPPHWSSPGELVQAAAQQFSIDKWQDQTNHVEVMVEKDALSGVLKPVCNGLDIGFTANKGYPSASLLYEMSKRLFDALKVGKDIIILHLGDHDPSGIDMTRDLLDRLGLLAREPIAVDRLALNLDQVQEMNPPPNPAKTKDTRFRAYIAEFGPTSWELDAIEPRQMAAIVTSAVTSLRDDALWQEALEREKAMKNDLLRFAETYQD